MFFSGTGSSGSFWTRAVKWVVAVVVTCKSTVASLFTLTVDYFCTAPQSHHKLGTMGHFFFH